MAKRKSKAIDEPIVYTGWGYQLPDESVLLSGDCGIPVVAFTRREAMYVIANAPSTYGNCEPVKLRITIEKA